MYVANHEGNEYLATSMGHESVDDFQWYAAYTLVGQSQATLLGEAILTDEIPAPSGFPEVQKRVRHHTDKDGADAIMREKKIKPAGRGEPPGVHVEAEPFGPSETGSARSGAAGSGRYIEFDDPGSVPNEQKNIGDVNARVVPTEESLDISDLNPVNKRQ